MKKFLMKIQALNYKFNFKPLVNILYFVIMLVALYVSSNISIFTLGIIFDIAVIVCASFTMYFIFSNHLVRNIINSIYAVFVLVIFSIDHLYYQNIKAFTSITSIFNAGTFLEGGAAQYGVGIDLIIILLSLLTILYLFITWELKENKFSKKQRWLCSLGVLGLVIIYLTPLILASCNEYFYNIIAKPTKFKFPVFIQNFGYYIYRYEDIATFIDSLIL